MNTEVIIALGSNLGDAECNLDLAVEALRLKLDEPLLVSRYWLSQPQNMAASADQFLNAVLVANTTLNPYELLQTLEEIERSFGRQKDKVVAPVKKKIYNSRSIDLDIIAFGRLELNALNLIIPHPRAQERLFVLLPLAEIKPDFRFPDQNLTLAKLIEQAPEMEISVMEN